MPKISVIIPVYNLGHYIEETIRSVLAQKQKDLEIIIVDDGSVDNTAEVLSRLDSPIRYVKQAQQGAAAARNNGVNHASGEILAFLDADDVWLPNKLTKQLDLLNGNPKLAMVFTLIEQFISPELNTDQLQTTEIKNKITPGYCASTMLIRKNIFMQVGYFDTNIKVGEFIGWFLKTKKLGLPTALIDEILVKRRIHQHNTSAIRKSSRKDYLYLLNDFIKHKQAQELEENV